MTDSPDKVLHLGLYDPDPRPAQRPPEMLPYYGTPRGRTQRIKETLGKERLQELAAKTQAALEESLDLSPWPDAGARHVHAMIQEICGLSKENWDNMAYKDPALLEKELQDKIDLSLAEHMDDSVAMRLSEPLWPRRSHPGSPGRGG